MQLAFNDIPRLVFGFHNPNHAAAAICSLLPLCWGWGRRLWLGLVLSGVLFAMLLLTQSRTGLLVAACEVAAWQVSRRRAARSASAPCRCRGLLIALMGVALWWMAPRLALDGSILNRPKIWLAGLRLFAANPGGVGLGNSGVVASAFLLDGIPEIRTMISAHITLLAEFGWVVGWVWFAFIGLALCGFRTKAAAFVGDDADGFCYEAGSSAAEDVLDEDRVDLPSEVVASAWGASRRPEPRREAESKEATDRFGGVEVVSVVPADVREDSRILVLLGGRGWTGEQAVRELGFMPWAVERGWCILAPSFSEGEYWRPESGSADVVASAVAALRSRHGLRPLPVFLFGYSAGGQLAALLQDRAPARVSAWGVYGCGVYPDVPVGSSPAYVACGMDDADRLRISRDFAYRYREAGGPLLWKPVAAAHELNAQALELAREFFAAVSSGDGCAVWGEDDTLQTLPRERIDEEFLNPLYNFRIRALWQRR